MRVFALIVMLVAGSIAAVAPRIAAAAPACTTPDTPPATLAAHAPTLPPYAVQRGIGGEVVVMVSLDAQSRIIDARVRHSVSPVLNAAALDSVYASTFAVGTHNCVSSGGTFLFIVEFVPQTPQPVKSPAPEPPACPVPDRDAHTIVTAQPRLPGGASSPPATGEVFVNVTLDAGSNVVDAHVERTAALVLDAAALEAARATIYETAVKNCAYVPSTYRFIVDFETRP